MNVNTSGMIVTVTQQPPDAYFASNRNCLIRTLEKIAYIALLIFEAIIVFCAYVIIAPVMYLKVSSVENSDNIDEIDRILEKDFEITYTL